MIDVGLIGLGPEWESRFRPALLNLRQRMRVRVVQSAVGSLAEQTAAEWSCDVAGGLAAVFDRSDVKAVLILDTAWYGSVPVEFACRRGKPAFLAGRLSDWVARAAKHPSLAADTETPLMPDFSHRYTPATSRLKELLATRLGRPDIVGVHIHSDRAKPPHADNGQSPDVPHDELLAAIDWVCHLVGTAPAEVRGGTTSDGARETAIAFRRSAAGGAPASAKIVMHHAPSPVAKWTAEVRCRRAIARLTGDSQIEWDDATDRQSESLTGERADVDVMLDHFSRRAVGGLIPVGTLGDLCRAARLARAADESCRSGLAVAIEPVC